MTLDEAIERLTNIRSVKGGQIQIGLVLKSCERSHLHDEDEDEDEDERDELALEIDLELRRLPRGNASFVAIHKL